MPINLPKVILNNKNVFERGAFLSLLSVIATITFSISLYEAASWALIFFCLVLIVVRRDFRVFNNIFFGLAAVYFLMNVVSISQSSYQDTSFHGVLKVAKNILLCAAGFYALDSEDKFKKIFQWFLIVSFFIGIDALIQGVTGIEFVRLRDMTPYQGTMKRLTGPFHHANDFGAYLSFAVMLFIGAVFFMKNFFSLKHYLFYCAGFITLTICLIGTYSRGAWVAVGIGCVFLAILNRNKVLFAVLMTTCVWALYFSPALIRSRAMSLFDAKNSTLLERKTLWRGAARMVQKSPLLGLGVNTYARNEPLYKDHDSKIDDQYAHNGYLQMAAEIGCLGLLSFLAVIACFYVLTLDVFARPPDIFLKKAGLVFLSGIFSFLIHSATDTDLHSLLHINNLWLGMGLALAARGLAHHEKHFGNP